MKMKTKRTEQARSVGWPSKSCASRDTIVCALSREREVPHYGSSCNRCFKAPCFYSCLSGCNMLRNSRDKTTFKTEVGRGVDDFAFVFR